MRISLVYHYDLRMVQAGGVLHYIRGLVKGAIGTGTSFDYWCRESSDIDPARTFEGLTFHRLCGPRPRLPLHETARLVWHIARRRADIERDADAVVFQGTEWVLPWLGRRNRPALVAVLHGRTAAESGYLRPFQRLLFRISDPLAMRVLDKAILVSQESCDYFAGLFPKHRDKIVFLPTFCDDGIVPAETREQARTALDLPAEAPILSYIGRLHPPKRLAEMIDVVAEVRRRGVPLLFVVGGDGPQRAEFEAHARAAGLGDAGFRYLGVLDRRRVGLALRASDASILLSDSEGMPLGLLESLAIGTPAIVSEIADHRAIVGDGGFVVPNGNVPAIADAVSRVLAERELFAARARTAGEPYLASRVVPRILDLIRQEAQGRRPVAPR
ncbi:MAG: glycosyltransferase family 4 protein [Candidatus Sumerlaeia bacterium]|nr:glycosyltransferase family 4 protein [Candidatus Sumerlaeia bacterium]